jgi:pyrroloquinoline-quinone synthase
MVIERVEELIDRRHLLTHPFYTKWAAGTLPKANLEEYSRQYYAFESNFPRFVSAIHARTEQPKARQALLDNLWDEEHGEANHAELWLRFAEALGVAREDVRRADHNEATLQLVDTYRRITSEAPTAAAVAALYAYERQVPAVARAKIDGLRAFYGITDGLGLQFFETHASLDVEHAGAERDIIEELRPKDEEAVVAAAADALDAWWSFLDAVDLPA